MKQFFTVKNLVHFGRLLILAGLVVWFLSGGKGYDKLAALLLAMGTIILLVAAFAHFARTGSLKFK
ncbi:MAG: hypothetical protein Q9P90_07975 [candidate division KSB1 bacterium]|nr:hypothetical protein [candidate division KSB1 bacterium]